LYFPDDLPQFRQIDVAVDAAAVLFVVLVALAFGPMHRDCDVGLCR
jgi:hypothetical protein